jgi:hypothetical protein
VGTVVVKAGLVLLSVLAMALPAAAEETAGQIYCKRTGGVVQDRIPAYGTNNPTPLLLANPLPFCAYQSRADGSTIYLLISTLITREPTLAALAYYAKVPYNGKCAGGPGSCYCAQLGGTDAFGGINAAGGGWILNKNHTDVLDTCIFPDESSIDSYGLFYHSAGIIRGKDLSKVLAYKHPN